MVDWENIVIKEVDSVPPLVPRRRPGKWDRIIGDLCLRLEQTKKGNFVAYRFDCIENAERARKGLSTRLGERYGPKYISTQIREVEGDGFLYVERGKNYRKIVGSNNT